MTGPERSPDRRTPRLPRRLAHRFLTGADVERLFAALDDEYLDHQRDEKGRLGADLWYWGQVVRSVRALRRGSRRWGGRGSRRGAGSVRVDLLHLMRVLRRSPASAGAAVITLALAVGVGTSVFAVADAVLLRPPPFTDPEALVTLRTVSGDASVGARPAVDGRTFFAWRDRAGPLATLAAYDPANLTLTGPGEAERVRANGVSPGFLALLGVEPALGRLFERDDVGRDVVVIDHGFWRSRLQSDPAAIGRDVVLGGRTHRVVGVLPQSFAFALGPADLWRPLSVALEGFGGGDVDVRVIARLADGASAAVLARALSEDDTPTVPAVLATPIGVEMVGDSGDTLILLAVAAAVAMIIAFGNLAVLLLVRSTDRRREFAVRGALGAGPNEAARQLVLEAVTLSVTGIAAGVVLATWLTPSVSRFALDFGALAQRGVSVSWRAIAAVGAAGVGCAIVSGLLPALGARGEGVLDLLRRGATPVSSDLSTRRLLVEGEVALAFVLLLSMGIVGRSLVDMLNVDAGFETADVLKFQLSLPADAYPDESSVVSFYDDVRTTLQDRLGAGSTSYIDEVPLTGDGGRGLARVDATAPKRDVVVRSAAPDYFGVMGIEFEEGRALDRGDDARAGPRAVLSRTAVLHLFEGVAPIGQVIRLDGIDEPIEVVGVVGDVRHRALDEVPLATVYLSALQAGSASSVVVVASDRAEADVVRTVREVVEMLDRDLPVYRVESMVDVLRASPGVPVRRLVTATLAVFGLLAVVLSGIGLFGVAAHEVASRRSEMALRLALGADPARLVRSALARGATMGGAGVAAGVVLSLGAVRGLGGLVPAPDPSRVLTLGMGIALLLIVVASAAVLPAALRAARGDPLGSLRGE